MVLHGAALRAPYGRRLLERALALVDARLSIADPLEPVALVMPVIAVTSIAQARAALDGMDVVVDLRERRGDEAGEEDRLAPMTLE